MGMFTNGNAKATRLIIIQLGIGVVVMVLTQVLGNLPSLDFLTPTALKLTSFIIGTTLTALRGAEMFFSKTASLLKTGESPTDVAQLLKTGDTTQFLKKP